MISQSKNIFDNVWGIMLKENSFNLSIGGIYVQVKCPNDLFLAFKDYYWDNYSNFSINKSESSIKIELEFLKNNKSFFHDLEHPKLILDNNEKKFKIDCNSFSGEFNLLNWQGKFRCYNTSCLKFILYVIFSFNLLNVEGFLIHAASLIKNGNGYLFPGKSGAGKTTITRLSKDSIVLSDEISLVRKIGKDYYLFGTPFSELDIAVENTYIPLKQVLLPKKDNKNYLMPVKPLEALEHLIPNVYFFSENNKFKIQLFNICLDLVNSVQTHELHFMLDPSFWSVIDAK